jgi:hypothetical protein
MVSDTFGEIPFSQAGKLSGKGLFWSWFRNFMGVKSLTFFYTAELMPQPGPGQQKFDNQRISG